MLAIVLYFCCKVGMCSEDQATRGQCRQEDMELQEVNLAVMPLQATRGQRRPEDMELQEVNLAVMSLQATRGQRRPEDMELQEVNLAVMSLQATRGQRRPEDMELQEVNLAVMPLQATRGQRRQEDMELQDVNLAVPAEEEQLLLPTLSHDVCDSPRLGAEELMAELQSFKPEKTSTCSQKFNILTFSKTLNVCKNHFSF
ncbi:hypothetical protein CesoFtcFv8_015656 [Champsocephalus esox]|uniref:Uncharacterized protein n=1 Tax=Champsocephalus esox TaxID=159716 RepID=A0AAN8GT35_9TELE|nr:hypothetical protein CesoFtcFv8_015656 [Champsocephalus esox]